MRWGGALHRIDVHHVLGFQYRALSTEHRDRAIDIDIHIEFGFEFVFAFGVMVR